MKKIPGLFAIMHTLLPPAMLVSPEAKPAAYTPPQEFAYDIPTRPGETVTLPAAK